jgi:hypothetical protein
MSVDVKSVIERIDTDELIKLTLDLANIDSPTGEEGPVAEYVFDWLTRQGFEPRRVALYPDRPNIVATMPGSGGGKSLCFNSHLDTTIHKDEWWTSRKAADPIFHSGWRDGDALVGNGVCNCKGPMATWLIAAKALHDSGVKLKGDLVLQSVVGEIGLEPVDEFQPPQFLAKEAGTRYATTHGGVGRLCAGVGRDRFQHHRRGGWKSLLQDYRVRRRPADLYALYPAAGTAREEPSAIARMSKMIQAVEDWAVEYEKKHRYDAPAAPWFPRSTSAPSAAACRGRSPRPCSSARSMWTCASRRCRSRSTCARAAAADGRGRSPARSSSTSSVQLRGRREEGRAVAPGDHSRPSRGGRRRAEQPAGPAVEHVARSQLLQRDAHPVAAAGPGVSVGGGVFRMPIENLVNGSRLYVAIRHGPVQSGAPASVAFAAVRDGKRRPSG